jgi:protein-S-isoprenylcysteine O-methyltransferase Ste14
MRATAIEFRLRMVVIAAAICVGFWSPWIEAWGVGRREPLLAWLALELTRLGVGTFRESAAIAIVAGSLVAAVAVVFRVWGTAYLGAFTVNHLEMQAGRVVADGPYRYVRNPLYLGTWCTVAGMAFAMPPTGAVFTLAVLSVFLLRLILGEEAFLRAQLGEPYAAYCAQVPRLAPLVRSGLPRGGVRPQWGRAVLAELTPVAVFVALAVFGWSYNNWRVMQVILIGLGASLVARAFVARDRDQGSGVRDQGAVHRS